MDYIVEYEICALLFLLIITIKFFRTPKFQNKSNKMFNFILHCAIVNIVLDIVGAILVKNNNINILWINILINNAFFMLQVLFPALLWMYVLILSGRENSKKIYWLLAPLVLVEVILLTNPLTGIIFYFSNELTYEHGPLFLSLYGMSIFYFICTLIYILKNKSLFRKNESNTIVLFILIIVTAIVIQQFNPRYLLTGVALSISIFLMFLTIQNPEVMLDPITGAYNYNAFHEYLRGKIADNELGFIMSVDVGEIRRVNSTKGIPTGNYLLQEVTKYILSFGKNEVVIFRMVGTRFIIVTKNYELHQKLITEITERFKHTWKYQNNKIMLIATIRYCEGNNKFASPQEVIDLIDLSYAKASEEGFGTTKPIDSKQLNLLHRKEQVKEALSNALANNKGFYMNYQPMFSVEEQKFCGAEALLRFCDSKLGVISPAEFIPIAENAGLMYQIDNLVIKKSCDFLKSHPELIDEGLEIFEINLSATEFNSDPQKLLSNIFDNIKNIEKYICFEVTETAITTRREVLLEFMNQLIKKEVRFAIDDFGTGYSNILQLVKLPFKVVKLDRVFVSQTNKKELLMLEDLMRMFNNIGLSTVFEGIETDEQVKFATELGVKQIQGYYYSRPLSEDDFLEFMEKSNN